MWKNLLSIVLIALSELSKLSKLTKPNPLETPVSGSLEILVDKIKPNAENVSYNFFSSTEGSKFPINILAPTSYVFLS